MALTLRTSEISCKL